MSIPRIYVEDVAQYLDQEVELRGWLYNLRSSGKILFLQVRDGSATIQCVILKNRVPAEVFIAAASLTQESSLIVRGHVQADQRSTLGYELQVTSLEVLHVA